MRALILFLLSFLSQICAPTALFGLEHILSFSENDLRIDEEGDTCRIRLEGCLPLLEPGRPLLPYFPLILVLPKGTKIKDVRVIPLEVETLRLRKPLALAPERLSLHSKAQERMESTDYPYPGDPLLSCSSGGFLGYSLGSIAFAPLKYSGEDQVLLFFKRTRFIFGLSGNPQFLEPLRAFPLAEHERQRILRGVLRNPEELPLAPNRTIDSRMLKPMEFPSLEGGSVSMVIITSDSLKASFEPLSEWRTSQGIPTVIKTTSWIELNYMGADLAERIRNFLRDAYQYWGINWVILGGDPELVPKKEIYAYMPGVDSFYYFIPSDRYYAELESDWDRNNNGILGEFADSVDLYPDIIVGRLPLRTPAQVGDFLNKLFLYEKNPGDGDPSYLGKALFMGSSMIFEGDGGSLCEEIVAHFPDSFLIGRIYESEIYNPEAEEFVDSLEAGFGIVHSYSHGTFDRIAVSYIGRKSYFFTYHAIGLSNSSQPFFSYNSACNIGGDDKECLSEHLFRSEGGAVAVLSLQRLDLPYIEKEFALEFFDSLFAGNLVRVGSLIEASELVFIPVAEYSTPYRYELYSHNLDGDPAMPLWKWIPGRLLVETPESLSLGVESVLVYVADSATALPLGGVQVTLWKDGEILATGPTNGDGRAIFEVIPETAGSLSVVAMDILHLPEEREIPVLAPNGYPSLLRFTIDDSLWGDGDGIPEPGETLEIFLELHNSGEGTLKRQALLVSSLGGGALVLEGVSLCEEIPPDQVVDVGPFEVSLPRGLFDRENFEFLVQFESRLPFVGGKRWRNRRRWVLVAPPREENRAEFYRYPPDTFSFVARSPKLKHVGHRFEGVDTVTLNLQILNLGGGDARNVVLSLLGDVEFIDSLIFIERIGPGEYFSEDQTPAFRFIAPSTPLDSIEFLLTIQYDFAEFQELLFLRQKDPPHGVEALPKWDGTLIQWEPSGDSLEIGYRIYRAFSPDETPEPVTPLPLNAFLYEDRSIAAGEAAYYWVTALDTFFNESEPTGPVRGEANPPQMEGSPIWVPELEFSSPLVCDLVPEVQGLEIVAATRTGEVYLFSSTGEILPGWPFSLGDENSFFGSPAAGDIDGDGELEIVVAPRGPVNMVYALEKDASFTEGWPRSISGGSTSGTAGIFGTPVIADLDIDGTLEVVVKSMKGKIYVWHGDGSGFLDSTGLIFDAEEGSWGESHPAVGEVDGDDTLDIVFGTRQGKLYLLSPNGEIKQGFPLEGLGQIMGSIVLGDVVPDSFGLEIAFVGGSSLYLIDREGEVLPGWPKTGVASGTPMYHHPSLADLTGDGTPEIILNGENQIFAFDRMGNMLNGFPIESNGESASSVALGWVNDTILLFRGDWMGKTHGFFVGASDEIDGFPIDLKEQQNITPTLADVDQDGLLELVVGSAADRVWIFKLGYTVGMMEWPMFKHDIQRTGNYAPSLLRLESLLKEKKRIFELRGPLPNPLFLRGNLFLSLPEKAWVEIVIFNASGRKVRTVLEKEMPAGAHLLPFSPVDQRGHLLPSGVYFLHFKGLNRRIVRKFLHLR